MNDLRTRVRDAVLGRRPVDARERWSLQEFVERFDALDRPFTETADPVHVTASAEPKMMLAGSLPFEHVALASRQPAGTLSLTS